MREGGTSSSRKGDSAKVQTPPAATAAADVPRSPTTTPPRRKSSPASPRPLAVLEVINKRSNGVFGEHDEGALVRLCACVETLLRRKAAEVSLLWSGMTERSLVRKGAATPGGDGGRGGNPADYARLESTLMRQFSEASPPSPDEDVVVPGEERERGRSSAALGSDGDGDGGGVDNGECGTSGGGRERSASDSACANGGACQTSSSAGDTGSVRRRCNSGSAETYGKVMAMHYGCTDGEDVRGITRKFTAETVQEESKLVDLGMNLFDLSSDQLLSLVERFFRNMELLDLFQVP